jgi:predicted transcriptional regulator
MYLMYLDKAQFRAALGLPHENTIYVLLLDHSGQVVWRGEGAYTHRQAEELEQVLAGTSSAEVL